MHPYIAFVALHHPPHISPETHNNPHITSRLATATCRDKGKIAHTLKGSRAFVVESRVKDSGFQMNVERTNPSGVGKLRERRAVVGKTGEEEVRERRQKGGGGGDSVDAPIALA